MDYGNMQSFNPVKGEWHQILLSSTPIVLYYTGLSMFWWWQLGLLLLLLLPFLLPPTFLSSFPSSSSSFSFPFLLFNSNGLPGMVGKSHRIRRCSLSSRSVPFHQMIMAEELIISQQKVKWFDRKAAAPVRKGSVVGANGTGPSLLGEAVGELRSLEFWARVCQPLVLGFMLLGNRMIWPGSACHQLYGNQRNSSLPDPRWLVAWLALQKLFLHLQLHLAPGYLLGPTPLNFWQAQSEWYKGSS